MGLLHKGYEETLTEEDGHKYHFKCECIECKQVYTVTVNGPDLFAYNNGAYAQEVFSYLTPGERELLCISGICSSCWDALMGVGSN